MNRSQSELEDMQLRLRIQLFSMVTLCEMETESPGSSAPPFFETPKYSAIVGNRNRGYKKPYVLEPSSKEPGLANLESRYYHEFSHVKVLGYAQPYPFVLFWESSIFAARYVRLKSDRFCFDSHTIATAFYWMDKAWGQYKQTDMIKKAMSLTRQLNSHVNRMFQVVGWGIEARKQIARCLALRAPAGLPFSADAAKAARNDYLDYGFDLAIEINESAKKNPPSKVQAPPCTLGIRLSDVEDQHGGCMYPMALNILELRFIIGAFQEYEAPATDPFPSLFLPHHGADAEDLQEITDFCFRVTFVSMGNDVHPDLINFAFSIIYKWFIMSPDDQKLWEFLKYYFANTPVLFPSGQLVRKRGGCPSGSYFTRILKAIISTFVGVYDMLMQGMEPNDIAGKIHWKDFVLFMSVPRSFSAYKLMQDAEELGFVINDIQLVDNNFKP